MGLTCDICGFRKENNERTECPVCKNNSWIDSDVILLKKISNDVSFLESMISLKEKNPIEYQLKLTQFKAAAGQQEQARIAREESNKVRCPKCGSTQITTGARGVNHFWGFIGASKTVNRCSNCGHTWVPR